MRVDDLIIAISYFLIPVSLAFSLGKFSRLHFISMLPRTFLALGILFASFVLLCGVGHLLRALDMHATTAFLAVNIITGIISAATAFYLIPMGPAIVSNAEKAYQDLVDLNEETAASKRKLFTFMNFLCHEIRNPLFAITSNIEFAQDMPMTSDLYESLTGINQSAHLMLRLVNDVLDLSKIESGKLQLEPQHFNLEEFFTNMASTMERQVHAKHQGQVKFLFQMDPQVPKFVQADSTRLLQICYNVLSNANKFTERGSISFSILLHDPSVKPGQENSESANKPNSSHDQSEVSLLDGSQVNGMASLENFSFSALSGQAKKPKYSTPTSSSVTSMARLQNRIIKAMPSSRSVGSHSDLSMDISHSNPDLEKGKDDLEDESVKDPDENADKVMLYLVFEDTGIGIAEEHLSRIFQPYTQSKLSDFRKHGGTGLGLSIINKLLEMMHGTVAVSSRLNQGTRFVIKLPVKVVKAQKLESGGNVSGNVSAVSINNPRPSSEEQHAMSFAKLDETMMSMEMDEVEILEKVNHVDPFSSDSYSNRSDAQIHGGRSTEENATTLNLLSSGSGCDAMIEKINGGLAGQEKDPLLERDGASTPIAGNKVLSITRQQYAADGLAQSLQSANEQSSLQSQDRMKSSFRPIPNDDDNPVLSLNRGEAAQPKALFALPPLISGTNNASEMKAAPLFSLDEDPTAVSNNNTPNRLQAPPLFAISQRPADDATNEPMISGQSRPAGMPLFEIASQVPSSSKEPSTEKGSSSSETQLKVQGSPLFALGQAKSKPAAAGQQVGASNGFFSLAGPPSSGPAPLFGNIATARPNEPPSETLVMSAPAPISAVPSQPRARQLAKFNFPKNKNMVLVVDDNGVNRKLLGKMLKYFNLDYLDAENGKVAVEIMERSQNYTGDESAPDFGLVLMDLCMPVMDGYEAIRQMRNKLNLKDVPILALTASAMEDEKLKALRAGATEFATKPLLRPALHKKCLEYLQEH